MWEKGWLSVQPVQPAPTAKSSEYPGERSAPTGCRDTQKAEAQALEVQEQACALARLRSVNTGALAGTGCAEQGNAARQACGGSEARVTWHRNVRHRGGGREEQSQSLSLW